MRNKVQRSLKVRIYPNRFQESLLRKTIGSCRFVYNKMLAERIEAYEQLKEDKKALYEYKYKTEKQYKEEFEFLKEVDSTALQQSRIDLSSAYMNFFKSLKGLRAGQKVGFPRFKKKKHGGSYRTVMGFAVNFENSKLKIAKLGKVKYKHKSIKSWYKLETTELKNITVSRTSTDKYFASLLFEGEQDFVGYQQIDENVEPKVIGLDCSMDKFYVDNFGNSPEYKRHFRINEAKLTKLQRSCCKKTKGSKNREKARKKVARLYERISNKRKDFIDKLSLKLIKDNHFVVIENLSLKGMQQALNLGKSISDLGYAEFVRKLNYKAIWNDKTVIKADKWFASSKMCSYCSFVNKSLALHKREWNCPNCGSYIERDKNAAINLRNLGLNILGLEQPDSKPAEKHSSTIDSINGKKVSMKQEACGFLDRR